ncbi:MAG: hypothetical protein BGO55_24045 [Sphingobacteriales bacterium 50-39]|nr:hypothetical protein [Sphingobacteriales bacterium]OJW58371.1 MAG: hypothetical protein BGO55_24045 [Sphingobacteriales bacterium 50-39]
MRIEFEGNEFTTWDLLEYLQRGYGTQISGQPFTIYNVNCWIRIKKLPDAYGGNRILQVDRYKELGNLRILTIERLNREDIEAVYGSLSKFTETLNKRRANMPREGKRKLRTELYYQLLGSKGKRSRALVISDNYKEMGIRENQFKGRSASKKRV